MDKRLAKIVKLLKEGVPTNSVGSNPAGYSSGAAAAGPCAGFDPYLFPADDDTLSQDFQTPAETGEDFYATYSGIYPVMKVSLSSNISFESTFVPRSGIKLITCFNVVNGIES